MEDIWQSAMDHAVAVARKAGQVVRDAAGGVHEAAVMVKSSPIDLVTQTDQKVEKLIIRALKDKFPTHCFIGEESVAAGEVCVLTDGPTWIIDPIDGTTNFVHTFPFVAVCIGFAVDKQEVTSPDFPSDIRQAVIATEFGSNRDPQALDKIFSSLKRVVSIPVHGVRSAGSAAINMCLVASGCVEAYYEIGIHVWDVAASSLIVSEAGGVLMDVEGGPLDLMSRRVLAANSRSVAERLVKEIDAFSVRRDDDAS
ncbi:inositol monophosphatase 1-like isoform X2 [Vanacampus margaritifer]